MELMRNTNSILTRNTYVFFVDNYLISYKKYKYKVIEGTNTFDDICKDLEYIITHSNLNKFHIFIKDNITSINEELLKKCDAIAYFIYQFTGNKTILHINNNKTTFLKKMYYENKDLAKYDSIQIQIDNKCAEFKDGDARIRITNTSKGSVVDFSFENNL